MTHRARFWIALAVFQMVFGLAVFAITRHYYLSTGADVAAAKETLRPPSPWADIVRSLPSAAPATAPAPSTDAAALARQTDEHFASRRYEEAARGYEQLLALDPANVDLVNNLALTLHYVGRSQEALRHLAAGAALNPQHQRLWLTTGFVNVELGKRGDARSALEKAASLGEDAAIRESAEKMLATLAE